MARSNSDTLPEVAETPKPTERRQKRWVWIVGALFGLSLVIGVVFLSLSLTGVLPSKTSGSSAPVFGNSAPQSDQPQQNQDPIHVDSTPVDTVEPPLNVVDESPSSDGLDRVGGGFGDGEAAFSFPKTKWPDVVGLSSQEASDIILEDTDNGVTIYVMPYGSMVSADYVWNRVRIFVYDDDTVAEPPIIG